MNFLDDLKLSAKAIIPLILMAALFVGVIGFGATRLLNQQAHSAQIINHSDVAILKMVRGGRYAESIGYNLMKTLVYEGAASQKASDDLDATIKTADTNFADIIALHPAITSKYQDFKNGYDAIAADARAIATVTVAMPGLAQGSKLKPAELDQMAAAITQVQAIGLQVQSFLKDLVAYHDGRIAQNKADVTALDAGAHQATLSMAKVGLLAIAFGVGFALWMTASKSRAPERPGRADEGPGWRRPVGGDRGPDPPRRDRLHGQGCPGV